MSKRIWIKLYMEILDDPKMGRLSNHLWRRAVECFLLAGKQENDGALPPVEEMAWTLRLSEDKLLEDLHGLEEAGVVHEGDAGQWFVTNFKKRQAAVPVGERVRQFREGNGDVTKRYKSCNEAGGDVSSSTSTSSSESDSDSVSEEGERVQGEGEPGDQVGSVPIQGHSPGGGEPVEVPRTPKAAMEQRDIRVFMAATGGRVPGASQYAPVIDSVRLLRTRKGLDDARLADFLSPFWLAWSTRKRRDGKLYDPGNISWLTEWALNEAIPVGGQEATLSLAEHNAAVIREVARRKNGRRV